MKRLPYRAVTATGEIFEIEFPLHPDTVSAVAVGQLLDVVLRTVSRELALLGATSNGDVLQALAMALAVRAGMIHAHSSLTGEEAKTLLVQALHAVAAADRSGPAAGHA